MNIRQHIKPLIPPQLLRILQRARIERSIERALSQSYSLGWKSAMTKYPQPDVCKNLVQGVGYCIGAGVEGHISEFGTMSGGTASVLAQSLAFFTNTYEFAEDAHKIGTRKLHLFDSFKGLPQSDNSEDASSPHVLAGVWGEGSCTGISKDQLLTLCSKYLPKDRILIYDGWFSDTLNTIPPQTKFALIHIDCDLYESTLQVLDHCFRNDCLSDGCIIFFDDWNCNHASPKYGERRAWNECLSKYNIKYSDGGDYGIMSHKVIIHKD